MQNLAGFIRTQSSLLIEKKYFERETVAAAVGNTLATAKIITPVVGIQTGTGQNNRVGHRISITQLSYYGIVKMPERNNQAYSVVNDDILRVMVVIDKQTNGVTLSVADLLDNTNTGTVGNVHSFRNLTSTTRFRILKDEFVHIDGNPPIHDTSAGATTSNYACPVRRLPMEYHYKFEKPLLIEYTSTTGAIAEIKSNNIYIVFLSHNGVVEVGGVTRVRYMD